MKYYKTVFFCLFAFVLNAQSQANMDTSSPDSRLYEVYETSYVDQIQSSNPFLIQRWNYYLDHAYTVLEEKDAKLTDYPTINITDLEHINILLLEKEQGLTHDFDNPTVYRISNTNKLLVYKSGKQFNELFKKSLKQ